MLISKKNHSRHSAAVTPELPDVNELLETEWLLTNSRGGFASGTITGCNTRRYHGLLVGSLHPPANRTMAVSNCHETLSIQGRQISLSNFEFDGLSPGADDCLPVEFRSDTGVHFDYELGEVSLTKSIYLLPDSDVVAMVYDFSDIEAEFNFQVRPLAAMRDFHSLCKSGRTKFFSGWRDYGIAVSAGCGDAGAAFLQTDQMSFVQDPQWWYNLLYRKEKQRGQDYLEDLWSPGYFRCHVDSPGRIVLWAGLSTVADIEQVEEFDLDIVLDSLTLREKELTKAAGRSDKYAPKLYSAAGRFVVERQIEGEQRATILAGYPWFLDWGRDTFIALPGLLLCTNRLDAAADVLKTFANAVSDGMVPNRFDDYGGQPHYNSIDASLWFVHAAFEYLRASCDTTTFSVDLLPAIKWIMESYRSGTRFGIHADIDGLITGGSAETQLTWMDAKYEGTAFTPRYGKAVEINALWYEGLCSLADYYFGRDAELENHYKQLAEEVRRSFVEVFWNETNGYLNDCVLPDGTVDKSLRPNQIYAVSLRFSPLEHHQQLGIVNVVQKQLLTPFGLRTLDKGDLRFVGQYTGGQRQRDAAYHNGTSWPYLIGPFIEAYLRVNSFSKQSRRKAMRYLRPLLKHLTDDGCFGSISEIFDGDQPQRPKGCFAQAWSVAEVLRAYKLINR
ncbi:MAG: amylo-alpha-1,6-glucosidase [Planctomycetota bacterium]|jgi:predicted glycogen debranching enzyme